MTARLPIKRGTDMSLACTWADSDGVPVSLTGKSVVATAVRSGATPVNLTVTVADQTATPGAFTISALASATREWPVGTFGVDVHVIGATREASETFEIVVNDSPSKDRT